MCVLVCACQVFGVDQQDSVCVSTLGVADQRERLTSQRPGTGDRGKHGHVETEVHTLHLKLNPCQGSFWCCKLSAKNNQSKKSYFICHCDW